MLECFQADEELEIWTLHDLLDQLFVREPETGLDDQCAEYHAKGLCWRSKSLAELSRVIFLQLIPRNELIQLDLAIVTREFAAKCQKEVFDES